MKPSVIIKSLVAIREDTIQSIASALGKNSGAAISNAIYRETRMKIETLNRIRKFTEDRDWDQFHSPANLAKSIVIEAAELLECFQWSDDNYDLQHVKEELADVIVYSQNLLDKLGLDADEIVNMKMSQNEAKYPVEKAKGKSDKYTEL